MIGGYISKKELLENLPSPEGSVEADYYGRIFMLIHDMKVKETELKPIDVDVRGYTNRFECQMCLAEICSEICLKNSDYEYCPYCGRKIKD